MLTSCDQAIVQRDDALPGLELLLEEGALAHALRSHLPAVAEANPQAVYVRYKPGMNCLVAYRLEGLDGAPWVYAKAHRVQDRPKLEKAALRTVVDTPLGPGRLVLDRAAVVVSVFPNDSKLRVLRRLGEEATRRRLVRRVLPSDPGAWAGDVQVVRYKPERRLVVRLATDDGPAAAVKFYTGSRYEAARIGARSFEARGALRLAPCLGRSDRHGVLAFAWRRGRRLSDALLCGEVTTDDVALVGTALAELHAQPAEHLPVCRVAHEAVLLQAAVQGIRAVRPERAAHAQRLATVLARRLDDLPPLLTPVHGDFYAKQVLLDDGTVVVLDFDEAARRHPAADLGNFIAHLERDSLRHGLAPGRVAVVREALLDGYGADGRAPASAAVHLYAAAALFQLAPHPFRFREPDWAERMDALLDRTDALVHGVSGERPAVRVFDSPGAASDPAMPFLAEALDPITAQRHLDAAYPRLSRLRRIHVRRHKPGRRCLVAYHLSPTGAGAPVVLLGKARAKGMDEVTCRLMETLRDNGFDDASPDGVSVPEPLGRVPAFRMWLQREVPGTPATELLATPDGPSLAVRVAGALHKVHTCGPVPSRRHTMVDELRILHERLSALADQRPAWGERLRRLFAACLRLGASVPTPVLCPIHRDFYPDHVLVQDDRLWLIDFDLYSLGDPALDAGNFVGHVTEWSLRSLGDPTALAGWEQAFEDAFAARSGEGVRASVRAYAALTLARHVALSARFPERRPFTAALLDLCEERLLGRSSVAVPGALYPVSTYPVSTTRSS